MKRLKGLLEWGGIKKDVAFLVISGAALLASMFRIFPIPFDAAWAAVVLCGIPIIMEAVTGLVTAFDIKADVLVSLALVASIIIGEYFAAGEVAFIMQLGGLLEELTAQRARAGIEKLVRLTPQTARVVEGETETIVPAGQVKTGDILRVLPGESIPVDGVVLTGHTSINQAVMTGESLPVDKSAGDEVSSGTVNQFGSFDMRAERVGEDSSIQRMIRLVQSADAGKAKIVGIADRWATWIVVIALGAAGLTWLVTGEILRTVTILVVFCPCALVLATPTAIMAAMGNATKHGFLIREGDALERLAGVSRIAFDKTGTLTFGTPEVTIVKSILPEITDEELYACTAAAEQRSEHPLGRAVTRCYQQKTGRFNFQPEEFQMIPGRGVMACAGGREILAGNRELLEEHGITIEDKTAEDIKSCLLRGNTAVYVAIDGRFAGYLALADTLRPESVDTISRITALDIHPVLITGDREETAKSIAGLLQIAEVHGNCRPEDKLNWISHYEENCQLICMIGDGVTDAPALKKAAVGIAMGGVGSDIAVDAADIVLVSDEIKELPHLLELSRRMMNTIKCNLSFSMILNFLALALAMAGILNPVVGALVHNAGSVLVIIHSAVLLKWSGKNRLAVSNCTEHPEKQ